MFCVATAAIREHTTLNMANSKSISCIALHTVVLVWQWKNRVGWAQCVKTMAKESESHGHEGKRRSRHCTSTGRGAAQSGGSRW